MHSRWMVALGFAWVAALAACGSDDAAMDQGSAAKAMTGAMAAGSQVQSEITKQMSQLGKADTGGGLTLSGAQGSFTVSGTVNNSQGSGKADVTGSGQWSTGAWKLDLDMTLHDWKSAAAGNLVLNGTLKLSYDYTSATDGTVKYSGTLTVSGDYAGSATFDLTITFKGLGQPCVKGTVGGVSINQGC